VSADLRTALQERLAALRHEQRTARQCLADLRARELQALDVLLRLDCAVRILEKELVPGSAREPFQEADR
jgi:hypothetical protein